MRMLAWLSLSVMLVIALTLVLLLPAFQFIEQTPRAEGLREMSNFSDFAMIPEALQSLLFPWLHIDFGAPYPPIYPIFFLSVPFLLPIVRSHRSATEKKKEYTRKPSGNISLLIEIKPRSSFYA